MGRSEHHTNTVRTGPNNGIIPYEQRTNRPEQRAYTVRTTSEHRTRTRTQTTERARLAWHLFRSPELAQERIEVLALVLEEGDLLFTFLVFKGPALRVALLDNLNFVSQLAHLRLERLLGFFEPADCLLKIRAALLRLQLLPHPKSDAGLVQNFVGVDRHANLVAYAQQQQPALWSVQGHLPRELVKALVVEVFADGANSRFTCLPLNQPFV
mmetsp:Transcript_60014/g.120435  ORF Transcript_60014/g.120435 Transcript_60014/m.120435 type:complete len:212 (+) Transcript_60014:53-688(+)